MKWKDGCVTTLQHPSELQKLQCAAMRAFVFSNESMKMQQKNKTLQWNDAHILRIYFGQNLADF